MDYETQRKFMVERHLAGRGITDQAVLNAFLKVERHKFIPEGQLNQAYADYPLSIRDRQTISQPYIVALMIQHLQLTGKEKVLEIGAGSGYQTAILAELAKRVYAVEWFADLAESAKARLDEMGYTNIQIRAGNGREGWLEEAPFERILIAAAALEIPKPLLEQLAEGGILLMPIGDSFTQMLTMAKKIQDKIELTAICPCVFVPLLPSL